eukprot:TRINITY_DN2530_c0_g2_i1.p1 TRINITY_DN2530_c0_g2~~TRINITY_DN2530_c0_g2_i1.p1  ORF type:complete len:324 (+),score=72.42 TRINITY_DN2530_c0_g2_i1:46-972(+)
MALVDWQSTFVPSAANALQHRSGMQAMRLVRPSSSLLHLQPSSAPKWRGPGASKACVAVAAAATAALASASRRRRGAQASQTRGARTLALRAVEVPRGRAMEEEKPVVAFLIGGPGSGKGTQCARVAKEFGYTHLSAGELLRAERSRPGSPLGELIERTIRSGGVVKSEVIAQLLEQAMRNEGWSSSARFLIDGYPRSVEQLHGWEAELSQKVNLAFCLNLDVSRDEMRRRLLGRAESSGRSDDNAETIEKRFATFTTETAPLLAAFEKVGVLQTVDGDRAPDEVWEDVRGLFSKVESAILADATSSA